MKENATRSIGFFRPSSGRLLNVIRAKLWGFPLPAFLLCLLSHSLFAQSGSFRIINSSGVARKADAIVISRETIKGIMEIPKQKIPVLYVDDKILPSQTDDLTRDGIWDELFFQVDIDRNSSLLVRVSWVSPDESPVFKPAVQCLLGVKDPGQTRFGAVENELMPDDWHAGKDPERYQNEGPVWESEQIAFRCLFDERNFISVLGKNSPGLLGDTLRIRKNQIPVPEKWGMEVLPFDSGFGAGGFALQEAGVWQLPRKAGMIEFRQLAAGPLRVVFDLLYEDWMPDQTPLNVRRRISMHAGKSFYKTELTISGFSGEKKLAVGISLPSGADHPSRIALSKDFSALFWRKSDGKENSGMLSMGILMPGAGFPGFSESEKSSSPPLSASCDGQYWISSGQSLEFFTFAVWEKTGNQFNNALNFRSLIETELDCFENPLKISR